jgi:hypothetical protein
MFPCIPTDIEDVLEDISIAYDKGFRFVHLHARNPTTGQQFSDLTYNATLFAEARRRNPGISVGGATSRKGEVELQIAQQINRLLKRKGSGSLSGRELARIEAWFRGVAIEAMPDRVTTFTPPEIRITNSVSDADLTETIKGYSDVTKRQWNRPEVMRVYYQLLRARCEELGVGEELELTTEAAFPVIERIAADPELGLPKHVFVLFLFGYSARLPIDRRRFDQAIEWVLNLERSADVKAHITVGTAISPHLAAETQRARNVPLPLGKHDIREVFEWAVECERVESFRAGLEDTPEMWGRQISNSELATHLRELCDEYGVGVITDADDVRRMLHLKRS